jgi:hypothetical protein
LSLNRAKLLHHTQAIHSTPVFDHFTVGDANNNYYFNGHCLSGKGMPMGSPQ